MSDRAGTSPIRPEDEGDRYLWDRSDPVDAEVRDLEQRLAAYRYRGDAGAGAPRRLEAVTARGGRVRKWAPALAAALVLTAGLGWLWVSGSGSAALAVEPLAGRATIDAAPLDAAARLAVGSWLETATDGRVRMHIDGLGSVTVHGGSRLGLVESRPGRKHHLKLDHGRIEAVVTAPPRLFLVDTPSALAVDLGCAYELEVDEAGDGLLDVIVGAVALEREGHRAIVPQGAACRLLAQRGPGIPWFSDAPPGLRNAIRRLETSPSPAALEVALDAARPRDVMTLWHLLPRVNGGTRMRVIERLVELAGMPAEVSIAGVRELDRAMLNAWWADLERGW